MLYHVSVLHSFLWTSNISLCGYTVFCLSIHQFLNIWGCFSFLVVINNNAAMNISFCMNTGFLVFWLEIPKSRIATLCGRSVLTFCGIAILFFTVTEFYISISNVRGSQSFHFLSTLAIVHLFNISHSSASEVVSDYGFGLHFSSN